MRVALLMVLGLDFDQSKQIVTVQSAAVNFVRRNAPLTLGLNISSLPSLTNMRTSEYNLDRDIPDLRDKVILITGGTNGLGRQALLALGKHNPKHLYFTGRDISRAQEIENELGREITTFIHCDHDSLSSVSEAARTFLKSETRLDVLVCNAGVMAIPPGLTKDGYEVQFGINHLSHALFVKLLLPILEGTGKDQGEARIVFVASLAAGHTPPEGVAFDALQTTQDNLGITAKWMRYGQSKLSNILYAAELARRCPWLTTTSLEPGTVWTSLISSLGLIDRIFLMIFTWWKQIPLQEGAHNTCWAATVNKNEIESGKMYKPVGERVPAMGYTEDGELAKKLWDWTQEQLKDYE